MQDNPQFELFSARRLESTPSPSIPAPQIADPRGMDDADLIARIAESGRAGTIALAGEAGRRRLAVAVPTLEAICRRFAGFGADRPICEQAAALDALAAIGGAAAANAVSRLIARRDVQGPTLVVAVAAAARLASPLALDRRLELLRHENPVLRAEACRCAGNSAEAVALIVDLLDDPNAAVHAAAACALGRLGHARALPALARLLRLAPSAEIVEAIVGVADDDAVVLLARLARSRPDLFHAIQDALQDCDRPLAERLAGRLQEQKSGGT